jgi:hypothetical protein
MGLGASSASATTVLQDISSAGPLTNVYLGNDLDCQIIYSGDTADEFYPSDTTTNGTTTTPGDCGTFVSVGASIYGPNLSTNFASASSSLSGAANYVPYTAGTQSAVTGAGSVTTPYNVTSTATAGGSGISVSQADSYAIGNEYYRTDITLTNNSAATVSGRLYHAADCYLQGSDQGYGEVNAADGAPACTATANNSPAGLVEEFAPLTAGSHYLETYYDTMWSDIDTLADLPDTCDCTTFEDNAAAINWDFSIPAHSTATYSLLTNFSATGILAGSPQGVTPPTITGTTIQGQVLTEGHGTWENNPTSYAYQWYDCDATGANCVPISGAVAQTYTLQSTDVGHTIRVSETGINAIGAGRAQVSAQTAVVTAPEPVTIATTQSAKRHKAKASIEIPAGLKGEADHATLSGANAAIATGTVTYDLYSSKKCTAKSRVLKGLPRAVTAGKPLASKAVTKVLKRGRYYWQVSYSGDPSNLPAKSTCGGEVLRVTSPVTVTDAKILRSHHTISARVACGVVPCTLSFKIEATVKVHGHNRSVTVATGTAKLKKSGFHGEIFGLTGAGRALARSASGKVKLRFLISARVSRTKLTSSTTLSAALS